MAIQIPKICKIIVGNNYSAKGYARKFLCDNYKYDIVQIVASPNYIPIAEELVAYIMLGGWCKSENYYTESESYKFECPKCRKKYAIEKHTKHCPTCGSDGNKISIPDFIYELTKITALEGWQETVLKEYNTTEKGKMILESIEHAEKRQKIHDYLILKRY